MALVALSAIGQETDAAKQALVERALRAMLFVPGFKLGMRQEQLESGRTSRFADAVLTADDRQLETIIARVYAKYLTLAEAQELARFFESDTGRALTAQHAKAAPNPPRPVQLSPEQHAEAQAFFSSFVGAEFARMMASHELADEIRNAIAAVVLPSPFLTK